MTKANWRSRSSSATVLPGAKACVSASVLPTATTTRRPDIRKPSTALSRAAMRWPTLRSSSWSTARQPSHSRAAASGSTISAINVRSVTWKGMERRDPFMSPRWLAACLRLLRHPLAAEVLLGDRECWWRYREVGDEVQVEPTELVVGLVNVGSHRLELGVDAARRGELGQTVAHRESVLARELRVGGDAALDVARLCRQPEFGLHDRLRQCGGRQQDRE